MEKIYSDGSKYEGELINGKKEGKGTYTYSDGKKYIGQFKDDKPNGQGVEIFPDGQKYEGQFKDGKYFLSGTLTSSDGQKYIGEWEDGKQNGKGIETWPIGDKYVGEFKDNRKDGNGTYTYSDGSSYIGGFKSDKRHGQGTLTYKNGEKIEGQWKDDKYIKKSFLESFKITDKASCEDAIKYGWMIALFTAAVNAVNGFFNKSTDAIYIIVGLSLVIVFFIFRKSRIASTLFVIFFILRVFLESLVVNSYDSKGLIAGLIIFFSFVLSAIFLAFLLNAMRGTYIWHSKYVVKLKNKSIPKKEEIVIRTGSEFKKNDATISLVKPVFHNSSRYQIQHEIGKGGMGIVYLAKDQNLDRVVAMKKLPLIYSENELFAMRFKNEMRTLASFDHPSIVPIFDADKENGSLFYTMKYIKGENLDAIIKTSSKLDSRITVKIISQVCDGLLYAHEKGVIHRDLKPANIMIDAFQKAYILDFGISKIMSEESKLTQTGTIIGSPYYMSPEQFKGEEMDNRSDLYSLGIILYEMLSGKLPFIGETSAVMYKHVHEKPESLKFHDDTIPIKLEQIVMKLLEKDKINRYKDAGELKKELNTLI